MVTLKLVCKRARQALEMAKNMRRRGKSARNGNAPSPYTKYGKTPFKYSGAYEEWKRDRKANKPRMTYEEPKRMAREFRDAAE